MKLGTTVCIALIAISLSSCSSDNDDKVGDFGAIEWAKTYGGSQDDHAYSVIQTMDGNFAVFGYTNSIDGNISDKTLQENDYWLIKINPDGDLLWSKTYGGSGDDKGQKIIQTSDGGFAIAGYSMSSDGDGSNNEGFHDNWILRLDNQGAILWEKSYGFAGHDHAYTVIETNDGGLFMSGFLDVTASGGQGNSKIQNAMHGVGEFWCHKLDANGNIEWRKYFGGSNNDRSFDAVQANDGGFVISGFTESNDFDITNHQGSYDYWVLKLDPLGNLVWQKTIGGSEIDQSRSIVKTNDNAYLIAGNSFSSDGDIKSHLGGSDFMVSKVNDQGQLLWTKNYGGTDFDYATSIKACFEGFLISGYSRSTDKHLSSNYGDNDFWVVKINNHGQLIKQKSFGGSGIDLAFDVIETTAGRYVVVGETESNDYDISTHHGLKDALIIMFN